MASEDAEPPTGSRTYRDFLRARSRRLREEAAEAGFFSHRLTSGEAREEILRGPLVEVLPSRFGIGSGEVLAHDDSVSGQWDVIIYDHDNTPHLYQSVRAAKYPIETVLAVISVRSLIDGAALDEVVEAAARLRSMPIAAIPVRGGLNKWPVDEAQTEGFPMVYLYGFEGLKLPTLVRHLQGYLPRDPIGINGVCVHGQGYILPVAPDGPGWDAAGTRGYEHSDAADGAFGLFVSMLYAGLMRAPFRAPNLPRYMNLARLTGAMPEEG